VLANIPGGLLSGPEIRSLDTRSYIRLDPPEGHEQSGALVVEDPDVEKIPGRQSPHTARGEPDNDYFPGPRK
jgi:hypothetical protein